MPAVDDETSDDEREDDRGAEERAGVACLLALRAATTRAAMDRVDANVEDDARARVRVVASRARVRVERVRVSRVRASEGAGDARQGVRGRTVREARRGWRVSTRARVVGEPSDAQIRPVFDVREDARARPSE